MKKKSCTFLRIMGVLLFLLFSSASTRAVMQTIDCTINPDQFTNTLVVSGESVAQTMVISNAGNSGMEYSFRPPPPAEEDDGLIAFYPFNGNTDDESGNGHDGTVNGATLTADRFGNADSAYLFDGINDRIELSNEPDFDFERTDAFSQSFWFNTGDTTPGNKTLYSKILKNTPNTGYEVLLRGGKLLVYMIHSHTPNEIAVYGTTQFNDGQWHHVVVSYDGSSSVGGLKIFVDSVEEAVDVWTDALTGSILNNVVPAIGSRSNLYYFDGIIDDIRIYSRALSEDQISELYSEEDSGGLIAFYPFNGNAGDESRNGHDGTVHGATLTADRFGNADSAYDFNGVSDYINCGNIITEFSNFTVMAWINIDRFTDSAYMAPWSQMLNAYPSSGEHSSYTMFTGSGSTRSFGTSMRWPDGSVLDTRVNHTIPLGEWHLIAQTYDGIKVRQYDNGDLINSVASAGHSISNSWDFLIGKTYSYPGHLITRFFDGAIDDLRVYSRALSESEISDLYNEDTGDGLLASYPFNGNANDESGNGHNGIVNGATLTADRFGNANSAYLFDGSNDRIELVNEPDFDFKRTDSFGQSFWINTSDTASGNKTLYSKILKYPPNTGYEVLLRDGKLLVYMIHSHTPNEIMVDGTTQLNDGQWHHVVVSYDGSSSVGGLKFFVDGIEEIVNVLNDSLTGSILNDVVPTIGSRSDLYYFNGMIDDIRIYNRALSESEISKLYNEYSGGLVAHFPFNGNAIDDSGNGHHGTVTSATLTTDRFGNADSAYNFNGSSDYINCGNIITDFNHFTVMAWININRFTDSAYMAPWSQMLSAYPILSDHSSYTMYTGSGSTRSFGTSMRWPDGSVLDTRVNHTIPLDEWHLITQTYDGIKVRQYDNGDLINSVTSASHSISNSWDFLIGKTYSYPGGRLVTRFFDGSIDDLRVYNRALSESEISDLYLETPEKEYPLPDWLSVEPKSGIIPPGSSMEIALTLNASNMVAGDYAEYLLDIFCSESDECSASVPVSMWVVPPPPMMVEEPPYTAGTENEVFWSTVDGPVEYWVEAAAIEHCSMGSKGNDPSKDIPKGWSNVKRFHDSDRWMQESGWIVSKSYLFEGLRLNTKYEYRVKASVVTEIGRIESAWSDWVESCQVPLVREIDDSKVPEWWKEKHFGNSANFQGLVDSDGDGLCDFDEYVAGGDPYDVFSNFIVEDCTTCPGGQFILHWDAVEGRAYSIYWSEKIGEPFQLVEDDIGYPQNSYTDSVHQAESGGFYKMGVRLAE